MYCKQVAELANLSFYQIHWLMKEWPLCCLVYRKDSYPIQFPRCQDYSRKLLPHLKQDCWLRESLHAIQYWPVDPPPLHLASFSTISDHLLLQYKYQLLERLFFYLFDQILHAWNHFKARFPWYLQWKERFQQIHCQSKQLEQYPRLV